MKKSLKKSVSILLSLIMVFSMFAIMPLSASAAKANDLTFTAEEDGSSVTLNYATGTLQYNKNYSGWESYTAGTQIELASAGDSVRFHGKDTTFNYDNHVEITGKVAASGSVMSLRTDDDGKSQGLTANCFQYMFYNCTGLTSAPELPETELQSYCYYYMFYGCTNLTEAPYLPATNLANYCYGYMFGGCTNLTEAPYLPATNLANYCYSSMFSGCKNLTELPALPATTLAENCYYRMFYGCTSLTNAPELPATNLAASCYYGMFSGCKSLTEAPELPATNLAESCYSNMFYGCESLTELPALPATTLERYCYNYMFNGCSKICISDEAGTFGDITYSVEYRIPTTGEGTSAYNALFNMFSNTVGKFTGTPNINTTYYVPVPPAIHTITWKLDADTVIDTTEVEDGVVPTHADATKAADAQYTYTFTGWNDGETTYAPNELPAATADVTYTATFDAAVNEYTITWKNEDGSVIDTTTVPYGEVPTHADAAKDADAQYTYTFTGWTDGENNYAVGDDLPAATADATYTATFDAAVNEYTITWKNEDGSVIDTTTVPYGEVPTHADAAKDEDDIATYKFIGWTPEVVAAAGDAEYTAVFDFDELKVPHGPQENGTFYWFGEWQKAYKLIEYNGNWYYVAENHKLAKNQTRYLNASMVEGTDFAVGYYWFDENGHMQTLRNGPMADGCFYKDNERLTAYQLVSYDNGWYFIAENHKYVKSVRRYLNASMVEGTDFAAGYYDFDADGRMIFKNGPDADGYFYLNNEKQKAYKLIDFEGDYYFVAEYNKYAKNQRRYLNASMVEGTDFAVGYYNFDADGKMILAD